MARWWRWVGLVVCCVSFAEVKVLPYKGMKLEQGSTLMYNLQTYDRGDESEDEKHSPHGDRLLEYQYSNEYCAYGPYTCPDWVGGANGDNLYGLGQKYHAENVEQHEGNIPQYLCFASGNVCLAQAEGKAAFKDACQNKDNPVHRIVFSSWNAIKILWYWG